MRWRVSHNSLDHKRNKEILAKFHISVTKFFTVLYKSMGSATANSVAAWDSFIFEVTYF
jgi:hypothetical protein